jgi:hypothetical protein
VKPKLKLSSGSFREDRAPGFDSGKVTPPIPKSAAPKPKTNATRRGHE